MWEPLAPATRQTHARVNTQPKSNRKTKDDGLAKNATDPVALLGMRLDVCVTLHFFNRQMSREPRADNLVF
jgi:hypothetical protein